MTSKQSKQTRSNGNDSNPPPACRRAIAMIAVLGLVASSTACGQSDAGADAVSRPQVRPIAAETLPDHIVNGDFGYPQVDPNAWTLIQSDTGKWYRASIQHPICSASDDDGWTMIPGFDRSKFGWSSTQEDNDGTRLCYAHRNAVEIQNYRLNGQYVELTESQEHTAIYQDIATIPGTLLAWTLKHSSANASRHVDSMNVMIGRPGQEKTQPATRIASDANDPLGPVANGLIASNVTTGEGWDTYTGTYTVPAGQTVTRFTFKAVSSLNPASGNRLDDIIFTKAYPLAYNGNGNTGGNTPAQKQ